MAGGASDAELVGITYEFCRDMVYSIARRITGSPWEAEDVVQSLFMDLGRRLHTIRDPARLPGFLRKSALRRSVQLVERSKWRRNRITREMPLVGSRPIPVATATELHRALERLAPEEREAAELKFVAMCSHEEVARELGVSLATARRRVSAARRKLVDWLGELPSEVAA